MINQFMGSKIETTNLQIQQVSFFLLNKVLNTITAFFFTFWIQSKILPPKKNYQKNAFNKKFVKPSYELIICSKEIHLHTWGYLKHSAMPQNLPFQSYKWHLSHKPEFFWLGPHQWHNTHLIWYSFPGLER